MKNIIKIIKFFFDIIVFLSILLVFIVMYNFFQITFLNKKYSEFLGYTFFEVTTGSMKEAIDINDVIIVRITEDVHNGDIISYIKNGEIITHRIIEEREDNLITKGDANNSKDSPITKDMVIGKVEKVIPKLGVWIKVLSDFKVLLSIIITILLFGLALNNKPKKDKKNRHSFARFIKNLKGIRKDAKKEETKD